MTDPRNTAAPFQLRVWFDLARAGNFPSVASNVLAALVLSCTEIPCAGFSGTVLAIAILAGCLLYAGGATFNDVFDAGFDARHRPERAIPRGDISRGAAAAVATMEMLAGGVLLVVALGASPAWTLALVATILAYDWVHKKWIGSVVLMAGCRVLLACALATLPGHGFTRWFLVWVSALFVYIVALSLVARWEYEPVALLLYGAWIPAMACAVAVPLGRFAQRLAAST
jgi:4-hydroxybenzoate polyprenyltransferase